MINTIKNIILVIFAFLVLTGFASHNAKAGVIMQSADEVFGKAMFEPGVMDSRSHKNTYTKEKSAGTYDYNYDYETDPNRIEGIKIDTSNRAIADKLLKRGKEGEIVLVDLDDYKTSVVVTAGQFVAVRLTEEDMTKWNFENRSSGLEFVKREKRGDVVIMLYLAKGIGSNRVNFDLLANNNGEIRAVDVKVLEVRVI